MKELDLEQIKSEVGQALDLLEAVRTHTEAYGVCYGLVCDRGNWKATLTVGVEDDYNVRFPEYSGPHKSPLKAVKTELKRELNETREVLKETFESHHRSDLRGLRRALLSALKPLPV